MAKLRASRALLSSEFGNTGSIVDITLAADKASTGDLEQLSAFHMLERLTIFSEALTAEQKRHVGKLDLAPIRTLKSLRELKLNGLCSSDVGLSHLEALPNLRLFEFRGLNVGNESLKHLRGLAKLEVLVIGNDGEKRLSDACLVHLSPLVNLRLLRLDDIEFSYDAVPHLVKLPSLHLLDFGFASGEARELLRLRPQLQFGQVWDDELDAWRRTRTPPRELSAPAGRQAVPDWDQLLDQIVAGELDVFKKLMFGSRTGSPMGYVSCLPDDKGHVYDVFLSDNSAPNTVSPVQLALLKEFPRLSKLALHDVRELDRRELTHVAALKELRELRLYNTQFDEDALAELRRLGDLELLDLRYLKPSEHGLLQLKAFPKLAILLLHRDEITDTEIRRAADALPELKLLRLNTTKLKLKEGIRDLAKLRNLKKIEFWPAQPSDEQLAELKRALPRLEFGPILDSDVQAWRDSKKARK